MEEKQFVFKALNPRNDEDVIKYFKLHQGLTDFLKLSARVDENVIKWKRCHFGAPEYVFPDEYRNKPLPDLKEHADEFAFVCEYQGDFVGFIEVSTYHIVDGKRPDDDIGSISDIFVKEEFRKGSNISLTLLKMGVQKLLESGKNRAVCNVQEDNKHRYLHFAMADGNVVHKDKCKRKDGSETIDYTLLIDLKSLNEDLVNKKFAKRIAKYHLKIKNEDNQNLSL